jgi:hypothetical protein
MLPWFSWVLVEALSGVPLPPVFARHLRRLFLGVVWLFGSDSESRARSCALATFGEVAALGVEICRVLC